MKVERHPALLLLLLVGLFLLGLALRYGTLNRCEMMRQEVRLRFEGEVPESVRAAPGAPLVVGLVERSGSKLLTFDLTPNQCAGKLVRLWFAEDEEVGGILMAD